MGLVALAGGVAAVRATGYSIPADVAARLRVLSAWQYIVMRAVGDRIVAPGEVNVADFADEYLQDMAEADRTDLMKLLALVEHGAPLALGYVHRFSSLDAKRQNAVLESLSRHDIALVRAGFEALKAVAFMAYYRLPESWPHLGYPGPIVPRSLP